MPQKVISTRSWSSVIPATLAEIETLFGVTIGATSFVVHPDKKSSPKRAALESHEIFFVFMQVY